MGTRGHIPRPLDNVYIATPDASRASSVSRSSSGVGDPPSAATLPPKGKARSKKRKPAQRTQQLNLTMSTSFLYRRLSSSPSWLSGERALLLQPGPENASAVGHGPAQGDHSAASAGLLLLSEEVATVSAAVASVCAFWVLLGTALCFVLRMRRRKRRRQRRRSRADAAQTAMLDEMIRSELARGRARLQCDGVEYCSPTYANIPRHLMESTHAFDGVDSENLYCSIPATSHSDEGVGTTNPSCSGQLTGAANGGRSHERRIRSTGSASRNCGTSRAAEMTVDTKTCKARLDHSRTRQRCQDGGRDTFIAREMSIRVTTVGLRQCTPAALTGFGRVPTSKCKHAFNDSRTNEKDVVFDKSRRKDPAGPHQMQSRAGRTDLQKTTSSAYKSAPDSVLPRQFCAAISSNANYCSDVSNFQCRHHATVEGRAGDVRHFAMTQSSSLSHHCSAQGAGGGGGGIAGGNESELRPMMSRPCTGAVSSTKAPVRFPKMGRSCLVMGELIRRDWVWRLGGGQPLGSLPVCERCDPCPGGRGLPAEVSMNNI